MPRMKNSKKPSSPYKKVNTLTSFGFTSPKDKEKTAASTPEGSSHRSKDGKKSSKSITSKGSREPSVSAGELSDTPSDTLRRGRSSRCQSNTASESESETGSAAGSISAAAKGKSNLISLTIKKDNIDSYSISPSKSKTYSRKRNHSHQDSKKVNGTQKPVKSKTELVSEKDSEEHTKLKPNPTHQPPIKLKINLSPDKAETTVTDVSAKSVTMPLSTDLMPEPERSSPSKRPVFSPPSHTKSSREVTPSKRVLEDIVDTSDYQREKKMRKLEGIQKAVTVIEKTTKAVADNTAGVQPIVIKKEGGGMKLVEKKVIAAPQKKLSDIIGLESPEKDELSTKTRTAPIVAKSAITEFINPESEIRGRPVPVLPAEMNTKSITLPEPSSEGRSKRARKPTQKLIELYEAEDIMASKSKPSHQNSETVISIKRCAACGATDNVFVKKFPAILCSDCGLLYIRFISKNIMPPCADYCDKTNIRDCEGCHSVNVNACLPPDKRAKLMKKDSTTEQIESLISSGSVLDVTPKYQTTVHTIKSVTKPQPVKHKSVSDILIAAARHQQQQKLAGKVRVGNEPILIPVSPMKSPPITITASSTKPGQPTTVSLQTLLNQAKQTKGVSPLAPAQNRPIIITTAVSPQGKKVMLPITTQAKPAAKKIQIAGADAKAFKLTKGANQPYTITMKRADGTMQQITLNQLQGLQSGKMVLPGSKGTPTMGGIKLIQPKGTTNPMQPIITTLSSQIHQGSMPQGIKLITKKQLSQLKPQMLVTQQKPLKIGMKSPPGGVRLPIISKVDVQPKTKQQTMVLAANSGPRVKHVSRSAVMAHAPPSVKPPATNLRLSALPANEKCKIWNEEKTIRDYSDDEIERSKAAKVDYDWEADMDDYDDDDDQYMPTYTKPKSKTKSPKMNIKTKFVGEEDSRTPSRTSSGNSKQRRPRCGKCHGCNAVNCTKCVYCKDMKKYGGPGKLKQCCLDRQCINKKSGRRSSQSWCSDYTERSDSPSSMVDASSAKRRGRKPKRYQGDSASSVGDVDIDLDSICTEDSALTPELDFTPDPSDVIVEDNLTNKPLSELLKVSTRSGSKQTHDLVTAVPSMAVSTHRSASTTEQTLLTADGTLITDQNPGFSLVETFHRLMADFIDTYDIDKVWQQGVAVVTSSAQPVRVLCFLCGSGGQHQLTYCSVCCEPFHDFCLEESDRPRSNDTKDWLCRNCRFCQVCGKLDSLLTCDRCTKTYHPECLGDNHTIEPTSAGIWVCNSCVKCTSCGATTPGGPNDKWNSDFSLCASCEALRLKGNFCPVCRLCYSDDDWECKMIGCSTCDSWTHSKCENLSDDLYELIGYVGDDEAQYVCRACLSKAGKAVPVEPDWLLALYKLRIKGFSIICASILDKKYSQSVAKIDEQELKNFYDKHEQELLDMKVKRDRSQSPSKSKSKSKSDSPSAVTTAADTSHDAKSAPDNAAQPSAADPSAMAVKPEKSETLSADTDFTMSSVADSVKAEASTDDSNVVTESRDKVEDSYVVTESQQGHKAIESRDKVEQGEEKMEVDIESVTEQPANNAPTLSVQLEDVSSLLEKYSQKTTKDEENENESEEEKEEDTEETPSRTRRSSRHTKPEDQAKSAPSKTKKDKRQPGNISDTNTKLECDSDMFVTPDRPRRSTRGDKSTAKPVSDNLKTNSDVVVGETTPLRKSGRNSQIQQDSPVHSTPVENAKEKVVDIEKPDEPETTPRRSTRDRSSKSSDTQPSQVTGATPDVKPEANADRSSTDKSLIDISSSSIPDGLVDAPDPVDLQTRFRDVEFEAPPISFESLKEGGHPLDIVGIQKKIETYKSVNEFVDDMVRVLQGAITRSKFQSTKAYKHVLGVKKLLEQEVADLFPWVEIHKSGLWEHNLSLPKGMLEKAQLPPSIEHAYALWLNKSGEPEKAVIQPSPYKAAPVVTAVPEQKIMVPIMIQTAQGATPIQVLATHPMISNTSIDTVALSGSTDNRRCQLCSHHGDDVSNNAGRLIYCGADDWVHVNCALWSAEVFEEVDGTLQRVHSAIARGKQLDCSLCSTRGATVGCCARGCNSNYHFMCARQAGCVFMEDKQVFCSKCLLSAVGTMVEDGKFSVMRTVTVDFAHAKIKKTWQRGFKPAEINIIAGSMTVDNLGYIIPESDYLNLLVPIEYSVTRIYWSTRTPNQRCVYTCKVIKVDTKSAHASPVRAIPDTTIVHDPDTDGYTPPELLCTRYPTIFDPRRFGLLSNAADTDYDTPQLSFGDKNTEDDGDLPNLMGIASALNKAAHRSTRKRRRKARKATLLYGSAAPEIHGNLDDDVGEILDMCTADDEEDMLDEREVIVLRDVDDAVAQEVVSVIENMSKEEADSKGGVQAVMQSILDKHKSLQNTTKPAGQSAESEKPTPMSETDEPSDNRSIKPTSSSAQEADEMDVDQDHGSDVSNKQEKVIPSIADKLLASGQEHGNGSENKNSATTKPVQSDLKPIDDSSRPQSAASSLLAYSTSGDNSPVPIDETEVPRTPQTPLLTPPKIVITDFSFDEPKNMEDEDPFKGVASTNQVISHGIKDRLKSLVRQRSESLGDVSQSIRKQDSLELVKDDLSSTKRRASLSDLATESKANTHKPTLSRMPAVEETDAPSETLSRQDSADSVMSDSLMLPTVSLPENIRPDMFESVTTRDGMGSGGDKCLPMDCENEHNDAAKIPSEISSKDEQQGISDGITQVVSDNTLNDSKTHSTVTVTPKTIVTQENQSESQAKTEAMDCASPAKSLASPAKSLASPSKSSGSPAKSVVASTTTSPDPSPVRPSPRTNKKKLSLPSKCTFTNSLYTGKDDLDSSDSYIIVRDRSPTVSETDSDSDLDDLPDSLGRIIVPPHVNCVVSDKFVRGQLPSILNAKVVVDRLPPDSDAESLHDSDTELYPEQNAFVPPPPIRDPSPPPISREIRKDIINYCEESEESSSTDEEELCKPHKPALRKRGNQINYNEKSMAREAADSDTDTATEGPKIEKPSKTKNKKMVGVHKPRPETGKIVLNKDGTIHSRTENIPSELQKTISDAIRKARNKESLPRFTSHSQAYAGAGRAGTYGMTESRRYYPDLIAKRTSQDNSYSYTADLPRLKAATPISDECLHALNTGLSGQSCQLTMISPSKRKSKLPVATSEEEIIGGAMRVKDDTKPANRSKPSSIFLAFEISSDDGFSTRADNWNDAWRNVTDAVRDLRMSSGCPAISFAGVNGLHMFGFEHTSIAYFTEQLYGARYCHSYRFKFHKPPLFEYEEELAENPSGCGRSEVFTSRKHPEMFSFIDSRYRKRPVNLTSGAAPNVRDIDTAHTSSRRATSTDLPMAMRFRHLKTNAREAAAVYSSAIHGRGLFCKRPIDQGEMIIEYSGEVIRHELCDKREKYYEKKGIGCYMFRIDDQLVVDATMKGNAARFINHCCDPNCFSKVIDVNGAKHIVIFGLRSIQRGEELTYDYKFPIEEVKIPCSCGAKKCRGFLN